MKFLLYHLLIPSAILLTNNHLNALTTMNVSSSTSLFVRYLYYCLIGMMGFFFLIGCCISVMALSSPHAFKAESSDQKVKETLSQYFSPLVPLSEDEITVIDYKSVLKHISDSYLYKVIIPKHKSDLILTHSHPLDDSQKTHARDYKALLAPQDLSDLSKHRYSFELISPHTSKMIQSFIQKEYFNRLIHSSPKNEQFRFVTYSLPNLSREDVTTIITPIYETETHTCLLIIVHI